MVHMVERSMRAHGHEMQSQLHQHLGASVKEKGSLGRTSVAAEDSAEHAVQEHEEVICSGHNLGQRSDFPCRNNSTLTLCT